MSNLPSILIDASTGSTNLNWISGKITGLIVGTNPNVHYRVLFADSANGSQTWANIPVELYEIASTAYVNGKSVYVQGNLDSDASIFSILAL